MAVGAALNDDEPLEAALAAASTPELEGGLSAAARLMGSGLEPAEVAAALGNRPTGHRSVPTAIYCAVARDSVEDAVTFAVRCGGDTDTIAAMAGAIAAARTGAAAIPDRWLDALEQGPKAAATSRASRTGSSRPVPPE